MTEQREKLAAALAGRYAIEHEIGAGGMATVHYAEDVKHRRPVAIKVLRPELAAALGPDRFLQEIEITARLNHPHVLPLLDSGDADGVLYYIMPYIEGESLRARLNRDKQLPIDDALQIVREAADALGYAHSQGVIHRDIKPENILLHAGHATIADFGIARAISTAGGERLTGTGLVVGTPTYMSPEQGTGSTDLDGRSDLYSLGCVFFEMLAGQPPFTGPNVGSITRQHLVVEAPSVTTIRASVPRAVAGAIARCLCKTPADRYQTADELKAALSTPTLEAALSSTEPEAPPSPPTAPQRVLALVPRMALLVATLLVAALGVWWAVRGGGGAAPTAGEANGLVVLPLRNLAGDAEQEYFADGMTDALISNLASLDALRIISRTSSMHFKGSTKTLPEIARELNVTRAVEGSVMQVEGMIQITVNLVDAIADRPIWSNTYVRSGTHVLALQSEVARDVAQRIRAAINPQAAAQLADTAAVDPEAHRLYLRGRFHWYRRTPDQLRTALSFFEQAVARDSTFAPAHAGIADTYGLLGCCGYDVMRPEEAMPRAKAAALRSLELNPTLAPAHTSLAWVAYNYEWNWQAAETELRRALELHPGYSTAHMWLSGLLGVLGRSEEALTEARRALDVDPLALIVNANIGLQLYSARRFDEAIGRLRATLGIEPDFPIAVLWLAKAYLANGDLDSGVAAAERFVDLTGASPFSLAFRGYAHGLSGKRAEALAVVDQLLAERSTRYVSAYYLAVVYAALDMTDDALLWLERAFEERSDFLIYLTVDPIFDSLRGDPRFTDLVRRVGLPVHSIPRAGA